MTRPAGIWAAEQVGRAVLSDPRLPVLAGDVMHVYTQGEPRRLVGIRIIVAVTASGRPVLGRDLLRAEA